MNKIGSNETETIAFTDLQFIALSILKKKNRVKFAVFAVYVNCSYKPLVQFDRVLSSFADEIGSNKSENNAYTYFQFNVSSN